MGACGREYVPILNGFFKKVHKNHIVCSFVILFGACGSEYVTQGPHAEYLYTKFHFCSPECVLRRRRLRPSAAFGLCK